MMFFFLLSFRMVCQKPDFLAQVAAEAAVRALELELALVLDAASLTALRADPDAAEAGQR